MIEQRTRGKGGPSVTCLGYGCSANLPEGAAGFTTIELNRTILAAHATERLSGTGKPVHLGKTTQVWDAVVSHRETGQTIALCRCTQMILFGKRGA